MGRLPARLDAGVSRTGGDETVGKLTSIQGKNLILAIRKSDPNRFDSAGENERRVLTYRYCYSECTFFVIRLVLKKPKMSLKKIVGRLCLGRPK